MESARCAANLYNRYVPSMGMNLRAGGTPEANVHGGQLAPTIK